MKVRALLGATFVLSVIVACATTGEKKEDEKVQATSEIIYEDTPNTTGPVDPFEGCNAEVQQGGVVFLKGCKRLATVVYFDYPNAMSDNAVEQNFQGFDKSFPPESTRERFTQQVGEFTGQGFRVFENSQVSPFRAEMLIVPVGPKRTKIVSCVVNGTTDFTHCGEAVTELVKNGIPQKIPGAPPPPPPPAEEDAGMAMDMDGGAMGAGDGMTADAGAGMTDTGVDAGTPARTTKKKKGTK